MKGYNKGDINKVLIMREQGRTRSNGFKIDKFRFNKDIGKNWLLLAWLGGGGGKKKLRWKKWSNLEKQTYRQTDGQTNQRVHYKTHYHKQKSPNT